MFFRFFVEIFILLVVMLLSAKWFWRQVQRRRRSWNEIVSQLISNSWGLDEISEGSPFKSGIHATTEDIWQRIDGCRGLLAMYRNAAVLIDLADYAAEHGDGADRELLATLRSDAFQIRLAVLTALMRHALSSAPEGRSQCAFRAAGLYSEMLATMTAFLQEHATRLFSSYLDAVA